jgi:membrane protein
MTQPRLLLVVHPVWVVAVHAARFVGRVVQRFLENKGLLLAGAVGYNALLSIVPLFAITVVVLSLFYDDQLVSTILVERIQPLAPGLAPAVEEAIGSFMAHRHMVGWGGLLMVFLVSTVAFRMIEDAMAVVFRRPRRHQRRSRKMSLLIQLAYVPLVGLGIALLTGLTMLARAIHYWEATGTLWTTSFSGLLPGAISAASFLLMVGLLTSFYSVMPVVKVPLRLALIGGIVAAVLWGLLSHLLAYFFANLSLIPVVYGSLGTIIVVLVSMEFFAGILIVGAQLVAEVDRSWRAGLRWWEQPPEPPPLSMEQV